jgi:hypothetical protein
MEVKNQLRGNDKKTHSANITTYKIKKTKTKKNISSKYTLNHNNLPLKKNFNLLA